MRTALRSLRCDSALMRALQRLSERGIDPRSAARAARINSGTDTLGMPSVLLAASSQDPSTSSFGHSLRFTPQTLEITKPEPSQRCSAARSSYKLVASA